jgi:high-affinity iron transporter
VAAYVSTLRFDPKTVHEGEGLYALDCASCHGSTGAGDGALARTLTVRPPALRDLAVSGRFTDAELSELITRGRPGTPMPAFNRPADSASLRRVVAFVRTLAMSEHQPEGSGAAAAAFATVRVRLDSAVSDRSADEAFDAYLAFEQVETDVRARNAPLAGELEDAFATLRTRAAAGAKPEELAGIHEQILAGLERAEREVADRDSRTNLFLESLGITLREGFEAILIIGALMAFLGKAGAVERRRDVAWGAWLAVAASLATFAGVELLFEVTSNQREALEGWTMLLATLVLFYVSYWLLSKIEADKWNSFVRDKVKSALSSGSRWALAGVAFLAVYREGFETILFYKALLTSSSTGGAVAVVAGLAVGCAGLVILYLAINQFGMRVPLRPFFAVTGGLLYYMAFVFAGKGIAELQNAGVVGMRPVEWGPRLPALGMYPTAQSMWAQGALLVLALIAVVWAVTKRPRPV